MKRILFLFSFLLIIALTGVMANEGTNYTAEAGPVLIQQVFGQDFGIGEYLGITANPSKADFGVLSLEIIPLEAAISEMSLSGFIYIMKTERMIFVNFSPGIFASLRTGILV